MILKPESGFDPRIEKWERVRRQVQSMLRDKGMDRHEAVMVCLVIAARLMANMAHIAPGGDEALAARKRRGIIDQAEHFLRDTYDRAGEQLRHGPGAAKED